MASREAAAMDSAFEKLDRAIGGASGAGQACCGTPAGNNKVQDGFGTGATRSTSEGKIDYEGHISPDVIAIFGSYMHAHRVQRNGQLRGSDNWQEGIPVYRYVKSLIRHTWEFAQMWRGTPVQNPDNGQLFTFKEVLCAIMFNVMGIIFELNRKMVAAGGCLQMTHIDKSTRQRWEREDAVKSLEAADPRDAQTQMQKAIATAGTQAAQRLPVNGHISGRMLRTFGIPADEEGSYRLVAERERW